MKNNSKAKQYSRIKYTLSIVHTLYLLMLLVIFTRVGAFKILADEINLLVNNSVLRFVFFLLVIHAAYYMASFFIFFYQSFLLEHQFLLSKQKISDWFIEQIKSAAVFFIISFVCLGAFYYVLNNAPFMWWLIVSLVWVFLSVILAQLAPVLIIPLFFKYRRFSDDNLRQRIMRLARSLGVGVCDVFEIDLSKKTAKANAALTGIGRTRRVIIADTLKNNYTDEEIEVILAHEFAHYKLKHIIKLLLFNSANIILSFYLLYAMSPYLLRAFGILSLSSPEFLPVIFIYWICWGIIMSPLENFISRRMEHQADELALSSTGLKEAFISTMEKLSEQNLADRNPSFLIKIFFYDHPPIDERIAMAKSFQRKSV